MSEVPCASVSERVLVQNLSCENEFDFHENELVGETHFHRNVVERRLVLTPRQKATRKWTIGSCVCVHRQIITPIKSWVNTKGGLV